MDYVGTTSSGSYYDEPTFRMVPSEKYEQLKKNQITPDEREMIKKIVADKREAERIAEKKLRDEREKYIKKYTKKSKFKDEKYLLRYIMYHTVLLFGAIVMCPFTDNIAYPLLWIGVDCIFLFTFCALLFKYDNYYDSEKKYIRNQLYNHPIIYTKPEIKKLARAYKKYYKIKDIIKVA